jgi:hypothetical protein
VQPVLHDAGTGSVIGSAVAQGSVATHSPFSATPHPREQQPVVEYV